MARFSALICFALLTIFGSAVRAADGRAATIQAVGVPDGFGELTRDRDMLVDLFFGDRKIGHARVIVRPGYLQFKDPDRILKLVPNLDVSTEVSQALTAEFPTNAALVCPEGSLHDCGELSPRLAGIIFDEDHFRVDLFVNRKWLRTILPKEDLYLSTPTAPLSLTSSSGLALSGSSGASPVYNLQNRTIIGFRDARIRSDFSYASKFGLVADTVVGEIDRPGLRYSAGLFWAPGLDLTGQRRILGAGVTTQFDTRTDRDILQGTPVVIFLSQPARVDVLVDGRLVTSRAYEAGNNEIDTSTLPNGSYSLILRIHDVGGAVREERRFFAKNPQIAPVGQTIYFAYAGMLANVRPERPVSLSNDLFYQFGTARRLGEKTALDFAVIGTANKPLLEVGGWLIGRVGRIRAAALASPRGDRGALLRIASSQTSRLSVNFELRRIWSHEGNPLIPLSTYVDTFDSVPLDGKQFGTGSYTQAGGSIGYQLGTAYLLVIGSLRKDNGLPADYSIGPSLSWPIVNKNGLQIALQADAEATRTITAGYVGVRMLFTRAGYSVSNTSGARSLSNKGDPKLSRFRAVGDTTAQFSHTDDAGTDLSLAAGLTRGLESTNAHAQAMLNGRFGSARGEILHNVQGGSRTQYALTLRTGAVLNRDDVLVGGRDLAESALVISIEGPDNSQFDVLVNGRPHGRVRGGQRLPIFLQPYRAYSVQLHPVNAASVWYDSAAREFTLYPGNVQHVQWRVEHLLTVFGRAFGKDGKPVADAMVTSRRGVGQSNAQGYFQIDTLANDELSFDDGTGAACKITIAQPNEHLDFAHLGKVVCQ